jgi:REP element-mobilizing transposase RayT
MSTITYRRNLPHIHPENTPIFITFHLAGSLPREVIKKLKDEREAENEILTSTQERYNADKKHFARYDDWLDRIQNTPRWLKKESIAEIVQGKLHALAKEHFHLFAYCIMPNHVHLLIQSRIIKKMPGGGQTAKYPIADSMRLLKGSTARECNHALVRTGAFWAHESYDHFIRDERGFSNVIAYILNNPVKARLVEKWTDWNFSYVHPDLGEW